MPHQITLRSTQGKRHTPTRELTKKVYTNGKVIRTTVTSKTLPSGEIQRASSQRVTYVGGRPIKPQYQAPKIYRSIPAYQPTPPIRQGTPQPNKRQTPVYNVDDGFGKFLVKAPPPKISSSPKPKPIKRLGVRPLSSQNFFGNFYTEFY